MLHFCQRKVQTTPKFMPLNIHLWQGFVSYCRNVPININIWLQGTISEICKAQVIVIFLWSGIEMADKYTAFIITLTSTAALYAERFMAQELV